MNRLWLQQLPSTDPAFAPLHLAESMLRESVDTDWPPLERAHMQAVSEAAWGTDPTDLDARADNLRTEADRLRNLDMRRGGTNATAVHTAELEALGYALGVTAVRVAIRAHDTAGQQAAA